MFFIIEYFSNFSGNFWILFQKKKLPKSFLILKNKDNQLIRNFRFQFLVLIISIDQIICFDKKKKKCQTSKHRCCFASIYSLP